MAVKENTVMNSSMTEEGVINIANNKKCKVVCVVGAFCIFVADYA